VSETAVWYDLAIVPLWTSGTPLQVLSVWLGYPATGKLRKTSMLNTEGKPLWRSREEREIVDGSGPADMFGSYSDILPKCGNCHTTVIG